MSIALWSRSMSELSILSMILRVILAMICGGTIGWDRQRSKHPAGMRTYMLVCLGACVVMITGEFLFYKYNAGDPARLGAQVISGIGFLGAGSIVISGRSKIRGLTTAAGLWTSACIGLVIGTGFLECGVVATFAVYIIVKYFKKLEGKMVYNDGWFSLYVQLEEIAWLTELYECTGSLGMKVGDVQIYNKKDELPEAVVSIQNSSGKSREELLAALHGIKGIIEVKYIS